MTIIRGLQVWRKFQRFENCWYRICRFNIKTCMYVIIRWCDHGMPNHV